MFTISTFKYEVASRDFGSVGAQSREASVQWSVLERGCVGEESDSRGMPRERHLRPRIPGFRLVY